MDADAAPATADSHITPEPHTSLTESRDTPAAPPTALVTGSARRVGRQIAAALVAEGWRVVVHAREGERARDACSDLGAAGWAGADLERAEGVDELVAAVRATPAIAERGGLDLLVNSASSFEQVARWEDAGIDGWRRAMAVNARAPYLLTAALLPELRAARALVVNVSDRAAHEHWPAFPIHSASKAALESLTLSGASALASDGVRMVAIAPGTILAPDSWSAERTERERAAGLLATPDRLITTILQLAADPVRSGEIITLDDGA